MVRQIGGKRTASWKALLVILVGGGAMLWHMLACTESPMSFSPDGTELAFVTMEPYDTEDVAISGTHAFRLMVLKDSRDLRVIEQSTTHMLTAPAFSPDGKHICYLRIPLLTEEQSKRVKETIENRKKLLEQATSQPTKPLWLPSEIPNPTTRPAGETEDQTLPRLGNFVNLHENLSMLPQVPGELVTRDVETGKVVSSVSIELPILDVSDKDISMELLFVYLLTRPQYDPQGTWVYMCPRRFVLSVNTTTGDQRVLCAGGGAMPMSAILSPDGKTIAVVQHESIGFIRADGTRAVYVPSANEASLSGVCWVDNKTLVVLGIPKQGEKQEEQVALDYYSKDGKLVRSRRLPLKGQGDKFNSGELAIAPDGKHMVIFLERTYFLDGDGNVLKSWSGEEEGLVQPTFTPDSKRVAFKYIEDDRAAAIVFFTDECKEISRVTIQPIETGTTRPADE